MVEDNALPCPMVDRKRGMASCRRVCGCQPRHWGRSDGLRILHQMRPRLEELRPYVDSGEQYRGVATAAHQVMRTCVPSRRRLCHHKLCGWAAILHWLCRRHSWSASGTYAIDFTMARITELLYLRITTETSVFSIHVVNVCIVQRIHCYCPLSILPASAYLLP